MFSGGTMLRAFIVSVFVVVLAVVAGLWLGIDYANRKFGVKTPPYPEVQKSVWLDQGWEKKARTEYHHLSQGTITFGVPYEWFMALEQPVLSLTQVGLLSDPAYLDRLGFIPSEVDPKISNNLPVGFARGAPMVDPTTGEKWLNPQTGETLTGIGFTCAGCHTGRMTYQGTALYIDGAGALTDVAGLRTALGTALIYTKFVPFRFDRFAKRLLGENASEKAIELTRAKLNMVVSDLLRIQALEASFGAANRVEGFSRLDALNRIGNQVFGLDLSINSNQAAISAPVNYPHIWWSSWFDWVQYNSSIEQPMVRNAGEAMGVRALVNLAGSPPPLFKSTVEFEALHQIETFLAGKDQPKLDKPYSGLRGPKWPEDILPPINRELAAKGAVLYKDLCENCHRPPVGSAEFFDDKWWTKPNEAGRRFLKMPPVPIEVVGTDPAQAVDMANREITVPAQLEKKFQEYAKKRKPCEPNLGAAVNGRYSFGLALGVVVQETVDYWYDSQNIPPAKREEMNGYRCNGIRAPLGYKARTLDGIWATAPYLHNGSVPTLFALLSPQAERPANFTLGHREFDPKNVGLRYDALENGTLIDTSLRGNWNAGHEFDDAPARPGVIGRKLEVEERRALVEYLKTF
jgi:hypothetical protein